LSNYLLSFLAAFFFLNAFLTLSSRNAALSIDNPLCLPFSSLELITVTEKNVFAKCGTECALRKKSPSVRGVHRLRGCRPCCWVPRTAARPACWCRASAKAPPLLPRRRHSRHHHPGPIPHPLVLSLFKCSLMKLTTLFLHGTFNVAYRGYGGANMRK
jgi:hypothetical protein